MSGFHDAVYSDAYGADGKKKVSEGCSMSENIPLSNAYRFWT